jgi:two-component system, chemotaxis family, response regulator Rcp1
MSHKSDCSFEILLVEDNPADADLTREGLQDGRLLHTLHHVTDGVQAMQFLRREGDFRTAPTPDLILLDLNLPKKDGREVLAAIKQDPKLKRIPVVVLTSSEAESDIVRSYDLHANCYMCKPVDLTRFLDTVRKIEEFWLTVVRLPHQK